tara:strand:+ start:3351 stop:4160 length:810 start_codon:yes stop_codon:yes gene_type:complete
MNKILNYIELFYIRLLKYNLKIILNNLNSKKNINKNLNYKEILFKLRKNGFVKIENFLNVNKCEEIIDLINIYHKKNNHKIWKKDDNEGDLRLFGAEKIDKLINEYYKNQEISDIGNLYIKSPIHNVFTLAGKTSFTNKNNLGSGGGWHKDSINPSFKSMLYLTNVNSGDGNLQLIEDSNSFKNIIIINSEVKKNLLNTRFKNDEIEHLIIKFNLNIANVSGKAGTLILFDGSYIHRGSPIKSETRYALTNYFYMDIDVKKIKYPSPMI